MKKTIITKGRCYDETSSSVLCYLRVSKENVNNIDTQESIVFEVAEEISGGNYQGVEDINYAGTDMERKGLKLTMQMARDGKIDTIVVQDLSRLARTVAEIITLISEFVALGIRLISIEDGIDTSYEIDWEYIIWLAILAEIYPKILQKKIKLSLWVKFKDGKPTYTQIPYGYLRDPEDRNHLIVDPTTAPIVSTIFYRYAELKSISAVAKELQEDKILTPSVYKAVTSGRKVNVTPDDYAWDYSTIYGILTNVVYIGDTICFKTSKYFDAVRLSKTHEGIISQALYDDVQKDLSR